MLMMRLRVVTEDEAAQCSSSAGCTDPHVVHLPSVLSDAGGAVDAEVTIARVQALRLECAVRLECEADVSSI